MEKQSTKVKMCGMMRPEDIKAVNDVKPDFVGFIFAENRKRTVSPDAAAGMRSLLDPSIKAVGVFLNQDVLFVADTALKCRLDYIQLQGSEDEEFIRSLRNITEVPVIKAFIIEEESTIEKANQSTAEMILLDSGAGSGETFGWEIISKVTRPYFLAGGLSAENAKEAVLTLHPYALDVSSGIETNGLKDPAKMKKFMKEVSDSSKEVTP